MRVDKAIQLGNMLLNNKLDTAFLQACVKGEKPITMHLEKPVPVFVVYLTAGLNENGSLVYYDDVYRLSAQHN
jgi:murein L,D-transpeptidase YcbB/YkuD